MLSYTELLQPSVLTHCAVLPEAFRCTNTDGSTKTEDLLVVVRGSSLLQCFRNFPTEDQPTKLIWVNEFPLQGTVEHLLSIGGSKLAIAYSSAKLVILEWNDDTWQFTTLSLHSYEQHLSGQKSTGMLFFDYIHNALGLFVEPDLLSVVDLGGNCFDLAELLSNSDFDTRHISKSYVKTYSQLLKEAKIAKIADICFLPYISVPTVAILADRQPNWAGLVAVNGPNTKVLLSAPAFPPQKGEFALPILQLATLPYDVERLMPIVGVNNRLMLLLGSRDFYYLDGANDLVKLESSLEVLPDLSNSVYAQLGSTHYIFVVLASGEALVIDILEGKVTQNYENWLPAGEPTTITVHNDYIFVGSRNGSAQIAIWKDNNDQNQIPEASIELQSLFDLYKTDFSKTDYHTKGLFITKLHEIRSYGGLSALTTIDNGLACAANKGVLIVEREMVLIESDSFALDREVEPGSFWILNHHKTPLLVSSYIEIEGDLEAKLDSGDIKEPPLSKRQKTESENDIKEKAVTEMLEIDQSRRVSRTKALPQGLADNQTTLAMHEFHDAIFVVQQKSIAVYSAANWLPLRSKSIETCDFADIGQSAIMTFISAKGRCSIYDHETLERAWYVDNQDTATISSNLMVSSQGPYLRIQSLSDRNMQNIKFYDASNLDSIINPEEEWSGSTCNTKEPKSAYLSLYAMVYRSVNYIGVHLDRLFVIYEVFEEKLFKRFTMPFAVNQSPILLTNIGALIFPGKKTHILVKDPEGNFRYHRLALGDDRLVDAIILPGAGFAWLDENEIVHFCSLDSSLDISSNNLPQRFIPITAKNGIPKTIAYHEDSMTLVVGINVERDYVCEKSLEEKENLADKGEKTDGENAEAPDQNTSQETEDACGESNERVIGELIKGELVQLEAPAPTYVGQLHILDLQSYQFQRKPVIELDEALISMCMVDYDEPKNQEILAIGTANLTVESAETNGHLFLYKFGVAQDDVDKEIIKLRLFAAEHLRGPVSSITVTMKYMAVSHGNQIHVYSIHGHNKLDPIAFFNTEIYVQDLKAARNILGLGEKLRAPRLVNFSTTPHRTDLLSSADPDTRKETTAIEFVSSAARGDLSLISANMDRRLQVFQYDPENLDSNSGSRLVPLADFYTGKQCTAMCAAQLSNNSDIVGYGICDDGALFTIKPLNEDVYRTFHILVHQLMERTVGEAGLNPKMFRSSSHLGTSFQNRMLDLDFAHRFWNLNLEQQSSYGRALGFRGLSRAQRSLSVEGRDLLRL